VKNIGFLMLLCAGIIFKFFLKDFNYSSLNSIVTILKSIFQSAGLNIDSKYFYIKTSETRYNKISSIEKIKNIPKNKPKQIKPIINEDFGHYLAGLIDGDGHFSSAE
jgi:flagellar basal body P-ring protein FlgI